MAGPTVSVIVPAYRERPNLTLLLGLLNQVRNGGVDLDVLIMDDDSRDGSVDAVAAFGVGWARIHVRSGRRSLSRAVLEGIDRTAGEIVVVMDADLSHPPGKIPELVEAVTDGADIAIGSRYVAGGTTDDDWGAYRLFKSRVATTLVRPLTSVHDPMAGFFAIARERIGPTDTLRPIGYKILLELIVRRRLRHSVEVPIDFSDRIHGESKLTVTEELFFLEHLRRLYTFKAAEVLFGSQTNRRSASSAPSAPAARDVDRC